MTMIYNLRSKALQLLTCCKNVNEVNTRIFVVRSTSNFGDRFENSSNMKFKNEQLTNLYETRLLKVAIIGVPNSGKSTIINNLVGRRVCSISSKVHTTRCNARAIGIHGNTQLVFLDTPGLVSSSESQRHHLERTFHSDGELAMLEADIIGVIHDVSNPWTRDRLDPKVLRLLHLYPRKHSFLMLNKIDALKTKRKLLDVVRILTNNSLAKPFTQEPVSEVYFEDSCEQSTKKNKAKGGKSVDPESDAFEQLSESQVQKKVMSEKGWSHFKQVFMISALKGDGTDDVKDYLLSISEPSPWLYPESEFTDQTKETIVLDTVRSRLLDHLPQEIPYSLTTAIEYFEVNDEGTISIVVLIGCPTPRIEKLVVGSQGTRIRTIAQEAELQLRSTFKKHIRLKVVVTSCKEATSNAPTARQLG